MRAAAQVGDRGALAALVGLLVAGILGMHALASHGAPATPMANLGIATPGATSGHQAAMTSDGTSDAQAHAATTAAAPTAHADASSGTGPGSGHDLGGMVMLCVVMLAAAAPTLLLLRAIRIVRPLLPATFLPAAVRARTGQWVRAAGPPLLWAFSVIRC